LGFGKRSKRSREHRKRNYDNHWKQKFHQKKIELQKQRKKIKILLACMIALILIFVSLFVIGYTGKQMAMQATETVDSFNVLIIGTLHEYQDTLIGIAVIFFVILVFVMVILSWIPRTEYHGSGAY
jgi:uncharacterized BrkB/YihY/UPF0761 family membrane protein